MNRYLLLLCSLLTIQSIAYSKAQKKEFRVAVTDLPQTFHPYAKDRAANLATLYLVHRPLVSINDEWQWNCATCLSVPSEAETSAKNQHKAIWKIQPNLEWGDGASITAADYALGFEMARRISPGSFSQVKSMTVHKEDKFSLVIEYLNDRSDIAKLPHLFPVPAHIEGEIWRQTRHDLRLYLKTSLYKTTPRLPGLYSNGYQLSHHGTTSVLLAPRKESSSSTSIRLKHLKAHELYYALSANLIDIVLEDNLSYLDALKLEKRLRQKNKNHQFLYTETNRLELLLFNLRNPRLTDQQLRHAIAAAIDRKKIIADLFRNTLTYSQSFLHEKDRHHYASDSKLQYEPRLAAKLLDQRGWFLDKGQRKKDGKALELEISFSKSDRVRASLAESLKNQLAEIGVSIKLRPLSAEQFISRVIAKGDFRDLAILGYQNIPHALPTSWLHSSQIPSFENGYRGQNIGGWRNEVADKLITKIQTTTDIEEKARLSSRIMQTYMDSVALLPLFFQQRSAVVAPRIQGFSLSGHIIPSTQSASQWRFASKDLAPEK